MTKISYSSYIKFVIHYGNREIMQINTVDLSVKCKPIDTNIPDHLHIIVMGLYLFALTLTASAISNSAKFTLSPSADE